MVSLLVPLLATLAAAAEPPPVPPAEAPAAFGFAYDGGYALTARHGDASYALVLGGLLQTRLIWTANAVGDDTVAFSIPRARLALGGHVFTRALTWRFQPEFGGGSKRPRATRR